MMNIIYITLRAIAQATENEERVEKALLFAGGTEEVEKTRVEGHFGNRMVLMSVEVAKKKDIGSFMKRIGEQRIAEVLIGQLEERVDDECVLHFRLDKQKAYGEVLALAENKDVIDVCIKIGAYPAKKERAIAAIKENLQDLLNP
jgi:RNA binding exosome subunit